MLMLYAILLASASISTMAEASAIKGHARPHEDLARSIKLAPAVDNSDVKAAAKSVQAPILESTKRIYNDESIRRLAAAQPELVKSQPEQVVPVVVPQAPVVVPQAPVVEPAPVIEHVKGGQIEPKVDSPLKVAAEVPAAAERREEVKSASQYSAQVEPAKPIEPVVEKSAVKKESAPVPVPVAETKNSPVDPVGKSEDVAVPVKAEPVKKEAAVQQVEASAPVVVEQKSAPVKPVSQAQEPVKAVPLYSNQESSLQAKKDEASPAVVSAPVEPLHIEVPAPDPGLVLSEPIDSTTKLLIDLDEHVQKFLPAEEQQQPAQPAKDQTLIAGVDYSPASVTGVAASPAASEATGKSSGPLIPYSSSDEPIVPPLPSLEGVEKASAGSPVAGAAAASPSVSPSASSVSSGAAVPAVAASSGSSSASSPSATRQGGQHQNQQQMITQLLDQLDSLQNRIQDTINQLVARRRYVMSALLRPMGTYVRRVRTNLERLQNRVNQLQAAAVSVGGGQNRPGGFVDAAAIETIHKRIEDISKRISDIVNRIRFSLTPTSAPLNSNGRK